MPLIDYRVEDAVGVITLNRPEKHNAQNEPMLEELDAAWRAAATADAVKVIVVRANGDNFSAGHDLKSTTSGYEPSEVKSQLENAYGWETEYYLASRAGGATCPSRPSRRSRERASRAR